MTEEQRKVLGEYERYLQLREISTYKAYSSTVVEYLKYLKTIHREYDEVYNSMGSDYRSYLVMGCKKLSRLTINNKLNRIKSFYHFLVKKGYIPYNPFYRIEKLKQGYILPKNILTIEEMGTFLGEFSIVDKKDWMMKSIIELLYGSGLRISEVVSLKWKDIDFENGYIYVTERKNGNRRRKVVAGEMSLRGLKEYAFHTRIQPEREEYIYPQKGETSLRCQLNRKLGSECRRLGLQEITSHSFRHSIATHLLRKGSGIREVQAFLGHKKIGNTQIYTRVVKEDLKHVIEKHHPGEINR